MPNRHEAARLFLVAPARIDAAAFAPQLRSALEGGDVAAVLISAPDASSKHAAELIRTAQDFGAAALIEGDMDMARGLDADGVHVAAGLAELRRALDSMRPKGIVGAGNFGARHAAMEAAEMGADYVFFGRPHGDTHDAPHHKALDLAAWWSEVTEIPAVVMGGRSLDHLPACIETGAAFVALNGAVWSHAEGPREAVRIARSALRQSGLRAA
jgi:thiamine-phosphate pyrophosphorylase